MVAEIDFGEFMRVSLALRLRDNAIAADNNSATMTWAIARLGELATEFGISVFDSDHAMTRVEPHDAIPRLAAPDPAVAPVLRRRREEEAVEEPSRAAKRARMRELQTELAALQAPPPPPVVMQVSSSSSGAAIRADDDDEGSDGEVEETKSPPKR